MPPSTETYDLGSRLESGDAQTTHHQSTTSILASRARGIAATAFNPSWWTSSSPWSGSVDVSGNESDQRFQHGGQFTFNVEKLGHLEIDHQEKLDIQSAKQDDPRQDLKIQKHRFIFLRSECDTIGGVKHSACDLCCELGYNGAMDEDLMAALNRKGARLQADSYTEEDRSRLADILSRSGAIRMVYGIPCCMHSELRRTLPLNRELYCLYEVASAADKNEARLVASAANLPDLILKKNLIKSGHTGQQIPSSAE